MLRERLAKLGLQSTEADRYRTAGAALALVEQLTAAKADDIVGICAATPIATSEAAMGTCLNDAAAFRATLEGTSWEIFETIGDFTDGRKSTVDEILARITQALRSDEHIVSLAPVLREAQAQALRLLRESTKSPEPPPPSREIKATPKPGQHVVSQGAQEHLTMAAAKDLLASLEREQQQGRSVHVSLNWTIEEDGTKQ